MGSRVRIATATCLVASGLLVGGAGATIAIAEPTRDDATAAQESEPDTLDGQSRDEQDDVKPRQPGDKGEGGIGREEPDDPEKTEEPGAGEPTRTPTPGPTQTEPPPTSEPEHPEEPEQPGSCEDKSDDCEPGWPWWPWPWPPGDGAESGGGDRAAAEAPSGRPDLPPAMQLPAELLPRIEPDDPIEPVGAVPGVGAAPGLPLAPITLPVVVAPTAGLGGGAAAEAAPLPRAPQLADAEPPAAVEAPAATGLSNASGPATSYRAGYTDYLRTARMTQVVALAAPGLAGMLVLTGVGGLVGYRQAKAGHAVRTGGIARFAN